MTDNIDKIPTGQTPQQKIPYNDKVLVELFQEQLSGEEIVLENIIRRIKTDENYDKIRDWAIKNKIATVKEFADAIKGNKVYELLGGPVRTPMELVNLYFEKNDILLSYKKEIKSSKNLQKDLEKLIIERNNYEQSITNPESNTTLRSLNEQIQCRSQNINLADVSRKIRIISTELNLHFNRSDIEDAMDEYVSNKRQERVAKIFEKISYAKSGLKGQRSSYAWIELASSMFESREDDDLSLLAKISLIKKFIWQVKRKIRNIKIENHIMPILIGGQGTGKSTVINMLLSPIEELTTSTDFKQITDDRNIDIWDFYGLKTDEMGYASRSDIDSIKFLVTTTTINRRVMRTNSAIPVRQNATFIGASNRELNQLIRDESGMRRFAGIKIRHDPNWDRLDKINMYHLWQTVDEEAEDPTIQYMDEIKAYQERARVETATEQWMNSLPHTFSDKPINAFDMYPAYKDWENTHYSKRRTDFDEWEFEMTRLLSENGSQYPFIVNDYGTSKEFQFIPSRAKNRNIVSKNKQNQINKIRLDRNREFAKDKLENCENYRKFVSDSFNPYMDDDVIEYQNFIKNDSVPSVTEEENDTKIIEPVELYEDSTKEDYKNASITAIIERVQKEKDNIVVNRNHDNSKSNDTEIVDNKDSKSMAEYYLTQLNKTKEGQVDKNIVKDITKKLKDKNKD